MKYGLGRFLFGGTACVDTFAHYPSFFPGCPDFFRQGLCACFSRGTRKVLVVDPAEFHGSSDTTLLPLRGLFLGCHFRLDFVYEKLLVELPGR